MQDAAKKEGVLNGHTSKYNCCSRSFTWLETTQSVAWTSTELTYLSKAMGDSANYISVSRSSDHQQDRGVSAVDGRVLYRRGKLSIRKIERSVPYLVKSDATGYLLGPFFSFLPIRRDHMIRHSSQQGSSCLYASMSASSLYSRACNTRQTARTIEGAHVLYFLRRYPQ